MKGWVKQPTFQPCLRHSSIFYVLGPASELAGYFHRSLRDLLSSACLPH